MCVFFRVKRFNKTTNNSVPVNAIKCIYRNTKIRIKFNDVISEPIHINKGVRQGCGLSPVLFNIYINLLAPELFFYFSTPCI